MCPHQLKLLYKCEIIREITVRITDKRAFLSFKMRFEKKPSISRALEVAFVFGCNIAKDESVNFIVTDDDDDHEVFAGRDKLTISLIKEW